MRYLDVYMYINIYIYTACTFLRTLPPTLLLFSAYFGLPIPIQVLGVGWLVDCFEAGYKGVGFKGVKLQKCMYVSYLPNYVSFCLQHLAAIFRAEAAKSSGLERL